jgi:Na+/H+-translocating membrane pyrophosphatase
MLLPPIAIGYFGGIKPLLGLTLGVFFSSFNCTYLWGNLGDSLQQARAFVETGHLGGNQISQFHILQSADQTGTMYRDVLSPSINMLLKAICMVTFLLILST